MALKLKYSDEHGILHINMSPSSSPRTDRDETETETKTDITDPKFDTINNRFGQYDLFGGKYAVENSGEAQTQRSLFRSRYNSIEEELANTPYAFATERSLRLNSASNPLIDISIKSRTLETSPSKDIEDDRFFNRSSIDLFGPQIDFQTSIKTSDEEDSPAFTVTQLIHAQDRYFDLSSRQSSSVVGSPKTGPEVRPEVRSEVKKRTVKIVNVKSEDEAFKVLSAEKTVKEEPVATKSPVVPSAKRKKESSFAILTDPPAASRPTSPRSLPVEIRPGRVSPFKGRGFREDSSRHTTPKTSAANSRANSPPRRRTNSLPRIDKMAAATLPPHIPPIHTISRPHSPRNFLKENIEEVRELSELNREMHEAETEKRIKEEEEALLKEMADFENNKTDAIRSVVCSTTTSRSNSPNKFKLRSRSNSPSAALSPTAILHYENISASTEYINADDGMAKPVPHDSRIRSVSRSQPHSNDGSPKHSKIPKRQNSVSPTRNKKETSNSRRPVENNLNKNQRFISNSTSSINETIRIGSQSHDKRGMSKSTQLLNIAPALIKGKPPISPGRGGPPPSNKSINSKRLSPIVGTPNKSPIEDLKPNSARIPTKTSPVARKPIKTAGNTPATSRLNSRQPSRNVSRDPSPDKRRTVPKTAPLKTVNNSAKSVRSKPVARAASTRAATKPTVPIKPDPKKPINRTNSMKSLTRTPSTKNLNERPPLLKKRDSKLDLKATSMSKINEVGTKKEPTGTLMRDDRKSAKKIDKKDVTDKGKKDKENVKETTKTASAGAGSGTAGEEVMTQDNETQYDKITNDKGELVILTKKNIISMTTAAITSQPLEVVTKVTNQLPAALEKAREKAIFERNSSRDSLAAKEDDRESVKPEAAKSESTKSDAAKPDVIKAEKEKSDVTKSEQTETTKIDTKDKHEEEKDKSDDKKAPKPIKNPIFTEDNVKFKPLLPPYNNPQVERARQRIDDILKSPEVSIEKFATNPNPIKVKETKSTFRNIVDKTKNEIKESKTDVATKLTNLKDQMVKQNEKTAAEMRSEATKIVDSIITPVQEPREVPKPLAGIKKDIEPIVMVVNEKINGPRSEILEKMTETLVKGEAEVEVQSSNVSTPRIGKALSKMTEGSESDKSQSNGGFPQSTSTTPKPPARTRKDQGPDSKQPNDSKETSPESIQPKPNLCTRLMGKCKKCCPCCVKGEDDEEKETKDVQKRGLMSKLCCRRDKDAEMDIERAAGKAVSIEFENETKRKRKLRDVMCGCCGRRRRVSDVSDIARHVAGDGMSPGVVGDTGCCGRGRHDERRDSILSDRTQATCCNSRVLRWARGACRRNQSDHVTASRRQSIFSKNKSLSPTLPPEDTRTKLDPSLVEHTSVMRGAIPVLPTVLAYFCLVCNVLVPGLGTIFSGMFCLCFGIPRFGVHDSAKHRIGSFLINLLVGCGQLFTVLFCLVGWGWSVWWGVILVRTARKYRKLKAEAAAEEAEAAPPVTANNHTRA